MCRAGRDLRAHHWPSNKRDWLATNNICSGGRQIFACCFFLSTASRTHTAAHSHTHTLAGHSALRTHTQTRACIRAPACVCSCAYIRSCGQRQCKYSRIYSWLTVVRVLHSSPCMRVLTHTGSHARLPGQIKICNYIGAVCEIFGCINFAKIIFPPSRASFTCLHKVGQRILYRALNPELCTNKTRNNRRCAINKMLLISIFSNNSPREIIRKLHAPAMGITGNLVDIYLSARSRIFARRALNIKNDVYFFTATRERTAPFFTKRDL